MTNIATLRNPGAGKSGHAGITLKDVESVRGNAGSGDGQRVAVGLLKKRRLEVEKVICRA